MCVDNIVFWKTKHVQTNAKQWYKEKNLEIKYIHGKINKISFSMVLYNLKEYIKQWFKNILTVYILLSDFSN